MRTGRKKHHIVHKFFGLLAVGGYVCAVGSVVLYLSFLRKLKPRKQITDIKEYQQL